MKKKQAMVQMDKLGKKMKKPLKVFIKTGDQEALHQFRVQVKKLKAMLTLYAFEPANKAVLKDFKLVKTVFKKAGDIRNAHINLNLIKKYNLDDEAFKNQQQKTLDDGLKSFKNKGEKYIKSIKKSRLVLQQHLHPVCNKNIRHFYQEKLAAIDAFFTDPIFDEELHTTRKNIKLLIYNQHVATKAIPEKDRLNDAYLDDLQNDIGDWHDHNLAIETLAGTRNDEAKTITELKYSNAALEKGILEKSSNFIVKVNAVTEIKSA
ncbi:MAG: CHAD domain-containing protein [Janthinobacterium lividum]